MVKNFWLAGSFNPSANNFDHLCMGKVYQERVGGLESVERSKQLTVLGKPRAGKTHFCKISHSQILTLSKLHPLHKSGF
jgi:hypothetical protein